MGSLAKRDIGPIAIRRCRVTGRLLGAVVATGLASGALAAVAAADSGTLTISTRPDGAIVGAVQAEWSSCDQAGDCSWQVAASNPSAGDPCPESMPWRTTYDNTSAEYKRLTWLGPLHESPGTESASNLIVSQLYPGNYGPGETYCLWVRAASAGNVPRLLAQVKYRPVLNPFPTSKDTAKALTRAFGRRFTYADYHWTPPCGHFPPKGGFAAECPFEWRNGRAHYGGNVWFWPLDGGKVGSWIYLCGSKPADRCDYSDSYGEISGGPGQPRQVPGALRAVDGPFVALQRAGVDAVRQEVDVRVRCLMPRDLRCHGRLGVRTLRHGRRLPLGAALFSIRGGQAKTVGVTPGPAGRILLRRAHQFEVTATPPHSWSRAVSRVLGT